MGLGWWQVEELRPVDLGEDDHQADQEYLNEQPTEIGPLPEEEILEIADCTLGEQVIDGEADAATDDGGSQWDGRQAGRDKDVVGRDRPERERATASVMSQRGLASSHSPS